MVRAVTPKPCFRPSQFRRGNDYKQVPYQRNVRHREDHYALVGLSVFRDAAKMSFANVVAIQERHLAVGLDVQFVLTDVRDGR